MLHKVSTTRPAQGESSPELLQMAMHDLKSSLSSVQGFTRLLIEQFGDETTDLESFRETALEFLNLSEQSARRMATILHGLLELSSLDHRISLNRRLVDVSQIVQFVVAANRPAAAAKAIEIECRRTAPVRLFVDEDRLREVLDNLIGNAVKFSQPHTRVTVRVCDRTSWSVSIEVCDQGPGLSEDDLDRVFHAFQRLSAEPTGGETSTGLGLAIVKRLVELHGGTVCARSEGPGQGSTFRITLPRETSQDLRSPLRSVRSTERTSTPRLNP